jgi:hypothetical protein
VTIGIGYFETSDPLKFFEKTVEDRSGF